eukprot:13429116-Alexandrium_andersonii.AAC.1
MSASLVGSEMCIRDRRKSARSGMSASPRPIPLSGSSSWPPVADKSNAAAPRSTLSCTCRGTGRPSLAC